MTAAAAARVEAARKIRSFVVDRYERAKASPAEYVAMTELEVRAMRDSGIVGPDLVAAATGHATAARENAKQVRQRNPTAQEDIARAEYTVAEADYWLAEAKAGR
jgi:hypothetical protein